MVVLLPKSFYLSQEHLGPSQPCKIVISYPYKSIVHWTKARIEKYWLSTHTCINSIFLSWTYGLTSWSLSLRYSSVDMCKLSIICWIVCCFAEKCVWHKNVRYFMKVRQDKYISATYILVLQSKLKFSVAQGHPLTTN